MRKHLFKIIGGIVALLVIALIALPFVVDVNRFRPMMQAEMQKALGREVTVGNLSLSLLAGGVSAEQITIADDPAFSKDAFLKAKSLSVGVKMMPLIFSRSLEVTSLTIDEPEITLLRNSAGKWNFSTMGAAQKPAAKGSESPNTDLSVGKLEIKNGTLHVGSTARGSKRYTYTDVNIEAEDISLTSEIPFEFAATAPGGGKMNVEGEAGPVNRTDASQTPMTAEVKLDDFNLASTGFIDASSGLAGVMDYEGKLKSDGKMATLDATTVIEKFRAVKGGQPSSQPVHSTMKSQYDLLKQAGTLTGAVGTAKNKADLSGNYQIRGEDPVVHLKLKGDGMPVEEIKGLLPAFGVILPAGSNLRGGTASANLSIDGPLDRLVITGPTNVSGTTLTGFNLASKMSAVSALAGIPKGNDTLIQTLSAGLRVAPEGIKVDNLNIVAPTIGSVTGNGTIASNNALNFRMNARLNKGGGVIGGMSAISTLGQSKGSIPFLIQGTTQNPVFIPDVAGAVGNTVKAPVQGVGGLFGAFGKKK